MAGGTATAGRTEPDAGKEGDPAGTARHSTGCATHSICGDHARLVAALFAFAVVRFVGMGTGNKSLYITGGMCLVPAMALKELGYVKGTRKRLGQ